MRALTVVVVLLGITGAVVALRGAFRPSADAALSPEPAEKLGRVDALDEKPQPEGAALDFVPASDDAQKRMARLAADCGRELYEEAKKQPGNARLLEQAAAHYRACLSHEPATPDAALFREARQNLAQIEKRLAELAAKPRTAPPPEIIEKPHVQQDETLAPPPTPAPAAKPKNEELPMVTPEGVPIRRERSRK